MSARPADGSTAMLGHFLGFAARLRPAFRRSASARRATELMVGALLCAGRKWVSRILCAQGREREDWSAAYKLFSRSPWRAADLFEPAIAECLAQLGPDGPIPLAGDELRTRRGGRRVKRSRWTADPLSPPFRINFFKGIGWMHYCVPLRVGGGAARGVPVGFEPVDPPPRPRRGADSAAWAAHRRAKRASSLSRKASAQLRGLRERFDRAGAEARRLLVGLDGAFCNRHMLRAGLERTSLVLRCRRDAKLHLPAKPSEGPRRVYGKRKFTPESVRRDRRRKWRTVEVWFGGRRREVRCKEVGGVLWQRPAGRRPLRLLVVAPTPYRLSPGSPTCYRDPAYLLVDDLETPVAELLQVYFDRWEIEVNHRDLKQHVGVSDAQVWNDESVDRLPAFMVACYSYLLLASLKAYGPGRGRQYPRPPKWQTRPRARPSCLDLMARFREEAARASPGDLGFGVDLERVLARAA